VAVQSRVKESRRQKPGLFCFVSEKSISKPERWIGFGVALSGCAEMTLHDSDIGRERLQLPASSWWIPSITLAVAILALATALA
jgi:hypothetical protein